MEDLATAHVLALKHLVNGGESRIYNLGSEEGFSVREIIETAKKVTGVDFTVTEEARRSGDPAVLVASSAKIKAELGWQPQHSTVEEIIKSAWKWHQSIRTAITAKIKLPAITQASYGACVIFCFAGR